MNLARIAYVLAGGYVALAVTRSVRHWRREHALTEHARAEEQAKAEALRRHTTGE